MPLKLDKRSCLIGHGINTRTQKHGSENVTALDIPIQRLALSKEELGEVLLYPDAYKALHSKSRGRPDEPLFGKVLGNLPFAHKVPQVTITLYLGRRQLKLPITTLKSARIVRPGGGLVWWEFLIQCVPDLDENHPIMESLFSKLGEEIDLALECEGYGAQQDLPLDDGEEEGEAKDEDDPPPDAEEAELSGTGKKIAAHARKKGK